MEETELIINYLSAWNWQIIALMFLLSSLISFALPRTLTTSAFYVGLFLVFVGCEFMSLKRKKEIQNE